MEFKYILIIVVVVAAVVAVATILGIVLGLRAQSSSSQPTGTASITVSAQNNTPLTAPLNQNMQLAPGDTFTPTVFSMKLAAVYLSEDVDPVTQNNIGKNLIIYLNPICQGEIGNCGIEPENIHQITNYFDFAQPSAAVNAQLQATEVSIEPGTYKYVRMEFCRQSVPGQLTVNNVRFQAATMTTPFEFAISNCGVTNAFATPLVVEASSRLILNLSYSLTNLVTYSGGTDVSCSPTGFCVRMPTFVPTVTLA